MKILTLPAVLIVALVAIAGCAADPERSATGVSAGDTSFEDATDSTVVGAECSFTRHFGLRSELKNWWDGGSLPVTWEVTWTENKYWDGSSRADHAPPEGFQGLTQNAGEGDYTRRLELSGRCSNFGSESEVGTGANTLFKMRPVVTIDGQRIPLAETPFHNSYLDGWSVTQIFPFITVNGKSQAFGCGEPYIWSEKTPRGRLYYEFVLECNAPRTGVTHTGPWPTFVIRNYSR